MKKFIFNLIRPFFVKDIDINEDFTCSHCLKPVLKRLLFCSELCEKRFYLESK